MGAAFKYAEAVRNEEPTAAFIPYSSHVTANAVKIRLHRARQALRERLHPALSTGGSA